MKVFFTNPHTGVQENKLYQWDQKVPMSVTLENVTVAEAVFNAAGMKKGIRRTMTKSGTTFSCTVPDEALMHGTQITIYFTIITAGRRTVDHAKVEVIRQLKPEGYTTDEDPEYVVITDLAQEAAKQAAQEAVAGYSTITKVEAEGILKEVYDY